MSLESFQENENEFYSAKSIALQTNNNSKQSLRSTDLIQAQWAQSTKHVQYLERRNWFSTHWIESVNLMSKYLNTELYEKEDEKKLKLKESFVVEEWTLVWNIVSKLKQAIKLFFK